MGTDKTMTRELLLASSYQDTATLQGHLAASNMDHDTLIKPTSGGHTQNPSDDLHGSTQSSSPSRKEYGATKKEEEQDSAETPIQKKPSMSAGRTRETGRTPSIKGAVTGIFRRSNNHTVQSGQIQPMSRLDGQPLSATNGSGPVSSMKTKSISTTGVSAESSPYTTRPDTPPSATSSGDTDDQKSRFRNDDKQFQEEDLFSRGRQKNRSTTGLTMRRKLSRNKIDFAATNDGVQEPSLSHRNRATSANGSSLNSGLDNPGAQFPSRQIWGIVADAGTGLKARRMSLSFPDDFHVDVADLYKEYSDQSRLIGRRGKNLGKGATAKVRLMVRKGCSGELYAVKEFRGKSSTEKAEDYEKKVKSEYSIAKSVHHPNVVETFRLCTHNGRWNHVMEFCDQGDLFNLVHQKYLSKNDHLPDRLCLFKQLVQGVNYLHNNGIAHRDIKLENLLLTKESKLKITDFGVSEIFAGIHPGLRSASGQCGKEMGEIRFCAPGMCGSPPYVCPEVISKQGKYDPRPLDVWGAAIVMLCMCANGILWPEARAGSSPLYDDLIRGWTRWNTKHTDVVHGITETDYPHVGFFDQHINPPALRRVLLAMLNPDPLKRSTIATVAGNRWLKHVECCQIDSYDNPMIAIDASQAGACSRSITKVVHHNHLPPHKNRGHHLVRLPGSTEIH